MIMARDIMVNGGMICKMEKERRSGRMERSIKGVIEKGKRRDKGSLYG